MAQQLVIEGVTTPPAPKRTTEMVKAAVLEWIQQNDFGWAKDDQDGAAEDIAKHWQPHMDGYRLAKRLEELSWWSDLDLQAAEDLDSVGFVIRTKVEKVRREWAEKWNIQPPFPIGTRITKGLITGLHKHMAATYEVKDDTPRWPDSRLLVLFEDAIAIKSATEGGAA